MFDVTRFNDNVPGLKTFQDSAGDIHTTYTPGDGAVPVLDINFSDIARKVLGLFGLKEPPMEKYGVENREGLIEKELAEVQAQIKTLESNTGMTKEASTRLEELKAREAELVDAIKAA